MPPPQKQLLVHGVLDAGSATQVVRVQLIDPGVSAGAPDIVNAVVTITSPTGQVYPAVHQVDTTSHYGFRHVYRAQLTGASLVPGGTYTLNVTTTLGFSASGTTTIPNIAPTLVVDTVNVFFRTTDTLRMAWPKAAGARSYLLSLQSTASQVYNDTTYTYPYHDWRAFVDTTASLAGMARDFDDNALFPPSNSYQSISVEVVAAAVDANYYEYFHQTTDPFAGAPPSRLTGALGVFGSFVPLRRTRISQVR